MGNTNKLRRGTGKKGFLRTRYNVVFESLEGKLIQN